MSRPTIRIDVEDARELATLVREEWPQNGANARLLAALARHDRYTSKPRHKPTRAVVDGRPIPFPKWEVKEMRRKLPRKTTFNEAMAALPYPKMVGEREKALRKATKRERRAGIRKEVFRRATDVRGAVPGDHPRCEGPLDADPVLQGRCFAEATDLSHLFGKGKGRLPESVRTCAAWCRDCHKAFGASRPSAAAWWTFIAGWLRSQGFLQEAAEAEKRAAFVEVRRSLPAAPRLDSRTRTE